MCNDDLCRLSLFCLCLSSLSISLTHSTLLSRAALRAASVSHASNFKASPRTQLAAYESFQISYPSPMRHLAGYCASEYHVIRGEGRARLGRDALSEMLLLNDEKMSSEHRASLTRVSPRAGYLCRRVRLLASQATGSEDISSYSDLCGIRDEYGGC